MAIINARVMVHWINSHLPRVRLAGFDYAPWLDLGWLTFRGSGIQWKHQCYLNRKSTPANLPPSDLANGILNPQTRNGVQECEVIL